MDMTRQLVVRIATVAVLLAILFGSYIAFDHWLGAGDLAMAFTVLVLVAAFLIATYLLRDKVWF